MLMWSWPSASLGASFGKDGVFQRPEIPVGDFAEEIFGDRLDIESRVAALLDRQRRDAEQFGMNLGQVEQLHALGRRAQTRARPDGDAAIQLAAFRLIVKLYIEKMPVGLAFVGENEKRVRMFAQQLRDYRAFQSAR